jgi:hypothetical protein
MVKSICLIDLNGLEKMRKADCSGSCTLDLSRISGGIYILKVETEKGMMQRKVNILK